MAVKIVVPFYPIDIKKRQDYFKICADVTGGEILSVFEKSTAEIVKGIIGQNVHAHGRGLPFPETSCIFAKRKIYTAHFNVVGISNKSSILRSRLWNRYEKVVALTDYAKNNFIKQGIKKEKIEMLPLPIDFKHYSKASGGNKFRKKIGLEKREPFVLVVGLRKGKNIDVIARACYAAGIKCVMVGPKNKSEVKKGFEWLLPAGLSFGKSNENNIFTGKISDTELMQAINAATMYVNSSDHTFECFSLITYQCASAGTPLCLPNFGVFDTFSESALFHKNTDHKQLANNITKYMEDNKLRAKNSKKAKNVAKEYEYEKVKKLYEEFYERIGYI